MASLPGQAGRSRQGATAIEIKRPSGRARGDPVVEILANPVVMGGAAWRIRAGNERWQRSML
jgi:hypothetical protein